MGDKRKRGRTQRKHFRQSREDVWKHDSSRMSGEAAVSGGDTGEANPKWQPFATHNASFEEYYKEQLIVPEDEWDDFMTFLRKPLPAAFRINATGQFFQDIRSQLENDFAKGLASEVNDENEVQGVRPLLWYPQNVAWHLNFSRMQLRKNQSLERFHEFLKQENEVGNITRQEAVSMVPPLFLDVQSEHHILDMCAAPGSKTFQLLEMMHQPIKPGLLPSGLVIANDLDVQRCNLLIHQTKRMCTANLIVTNHEAQQFPSCSLPKGSNSTGNTTADILLFDRILCDVPCSGDGTLRKAPDIWRKWNAGMGNGLHRLQVEIAMRGIYLLKVGGRMVYSTCSINPIENEAVVAEILRRAGDSIKLLDVSDELPELIRCPGLKSWKVRDKGSWFTSYKNVPRYRRSAILPSMFPSGNVGSEIDIDQADSKYRRDRPRAEMNSEVLGGRNGESSQLNGSEDAYLVDEVSSGTSTNDIDADSTDPEVSEFPLEYCMRIVPHHQNTGAFFIAVFQKQSNCHAFPKDIPETLETKHVTESVQSNPSAHDEDAAEVKIDGADECAQLDLSSKYVDQCSEGQMEEDKIITEEGNGQAAALNKNRKLQIQGRWKGVDPVVYFSHEATIASITSFYGIDESFSLKGHLVTRNHDIGHVKRIYYISKSAYETLELNFRAGHRLKIASLGLKTFERQSMKDGSSCAFRLSSEGLPLLLPYIRKQILYASLIDFRHLLKYRTIKFADFVDAKFGEEASALLPGCCVVVLRDESRNGSSFVVDASTIAIICWKGKTNLCILVSPLDGKELLERIAFRFGHPVDVQIEDAGLEDDGAGGAVDPADAGSAEGDEANEMLDPHADRIGEEHSATAEDGA